MPDRLARLIRERQPVVALSGAGVSTESGIPDFRSREGLWAEFDPFEYASLEAFRRDPEKVWRFYRPRISVLTEAEPNAAHAALAELEHLGLLRAVVTQNIDLLHARATERLWERWPGLRVRHLMHWPPITALATLSLDEAAALMERERVHRLVVVEPGRDRPVGILSTTDLVHAMVQGAPR